MKYPPSRRLVRLPCPAEFPPSPLMLEIQAAGLEGDALLARFLTKNTHAQARSKKVSRLLLGSLVLAAVGYRLLHPEWPLSLLPNWFQ